MAALAGLQVGIEDSADRTHEGAAFLGDLHVVAIDVHQPVVDHGREARAFGSKIDIGDYLGLTTETVSRTLPRLKQSGIIFLNSDRRVSIADAATLEEIAEGF